MGDGAVVVAGEVAQPVARRGSAGTTRPSRPGTGVRAPASPVCPAALAVSWARPAGVSWLRKLRQNTPQADLAVLAGSAGRGVLAPQAPPEHPSSRPRCVAKPSATGANAAVPGKRPYREVGWKEREMPLDELYPVLLAGGLVVVVSIAAARLVSRVGLPVLLAYLAVGMLVGESGLGLRFDDDLLAQSLGTPRWR